jgi:hypothetical protein
MKTKALWMLIVVFAVSTMPTYAMVEGVSVTPQTMAEFQRAFSGTKPVIAASEYQASKYVTSLPKTTLTLSRVRTETVVKGQGTKPGIRPAYGSAHRWIGGEATASNPSIRR